MDFSVDGAGIELTVLLTVVSGKKAVCNYLNFLCPQIDFERSEVIVPFDKWSLEVGTLAEEFREVNFHFIEELGLASDPRISSHEHRLYDRRRAIGLRLSRGQIIAMAEDHTRPADDWVRKIIAAHEQPYEVIGGAVENDVDRPLNRAWYYCDFGRYGRPFESGEVQFVSDVNLAYKRAALMEIQEIWYEAYHETTVHWALLSRGKKLFLDDRPVVFQIRPHLSFGQAVKQRIDWGRVFAETRTKDLTALHRFLFAAGSLFLPPIMLSRVHKYMRRQQRSVGTMMSTLPIAFILLAGWSVGEFLGYVLSEPKRKQVVLSAVKTTETLV